MPCEECKPEDSKTFSTEIAIHFPGLNGLTKPIVWAFPKIHVCLRCGSAAFTIPETEMDVLRTGKPIGGAVVLMDRV